MNYMVVYSSETGNTKQVAKTIFETIPGELKDIVAIEDFDGKEADVYFVGFWTNRGNCDMKVVDLLSKLSDKKVALFGTCGMGTDERYYKEIEQRVNVWVSDDCDYLGAFLCQGKMPMQVRKKYEAMLVGGNNVEQVNHMIENFDEALLHPNKEDERNAVDFVNNIVKSL